MDQQNSENNPKTEQRSNSGSIHPKKSHRDLWLFIWCASREKHTMSIECMKLMFLGFETSEDCSQTVKVWTTHLNTDSPRLADKCLNRNPTPSIAIVRSSQVTVSNTRNECVRQTPNKRLVRFLDQYLAFKISIIILAWWYFCCHITIPPVGVLCGGHNPLMQIKL